MDFTSEAILKSLLIDVHIEWKKEKEISKTHLHCLQNVTVILSIQHQKHGRLSATVEQRGTTT